MTKKIGTKMMITKKIEMKMMRRRSQLHKPEMKRKMKIITMAMMTKMKKRNY